MRNRDHAYQQLFHTVQCAGGLVDTLHVDTTYDPSKTLTQEEQDYRSTLVTMGNILEAAKPFIHHRELRWAIINMLSAFDNWEDCFSSVNAASIPISPHKPRAVPLVPDQE